MRQLRVVASALRVFSWLLGNAVLRPVRVAAWLIPYPAGGEEPAHGVRERLARHAGLLGDVLLCKHRWRVSHAWSVAHASALLFEQAQEIQKHLVGLFTREREIACRERDGALAAGLGSIAARCGGWTPAVRCCPRDRELGRPILSSVKPR